MYIVLIYSRKLKNYMKLTFFTLISFVKQKLLNLNNLFTGYIIKKKVITDLRMIVDFNSNYLPWNIYIGYIILFLECKNMFLLSIPENCVPCRKKTDYSEKAMTIKW